MAFEVKATHRGTTTGYAACEIHPDVYIDEWGQIFETPDPPEDANAVAVVRTIPPGKDAPVFVVEDDAVELAVAWIAVLGDWQDPQWLQQRAHRRWATSSETTGRSGPDVDRARRHGPGRSVEFEVRASHRVGGAPACEIYPDVFVSQGRSAAVSRWAGMAMQQPGDFADALPADTHEWFPVRGLDQARDWVQTIAEAQDRFWREQHGDRTFLPPPVGPMGPACPPRHRLTS